jgi:hypothetical protein
LVQKKNDTVELLPDRAQKMKKDDIKKNATDTVAKKISAVSM